ncbi:MAG: metallophosphoesterase [Pirellulales bacterium]|nr:metallophosphoesterase [Pirellulales bacterium]
MRLAWLTDLHLNFLPADRIEWFFNQVERQRPDAFVITGDFSEAHEVIPLLEWLGRSWKQPIYYVLGNHDYYGGSIREIRAAATELSTRLPRLQYLTSLAQPVALTPRVALVGHDGWADGRVGDYERSMVMMNDYKLIAELSGHTKLSRWPILRQLGLEGAEHLRTQLPLACRMAGHILVATHYPPLREACWHEGTLSDDEWAPHFTCLAMGEALLEVAAEHPQHLFTVLCGHTHSPGECRPLPNLHIMTGGARYGAPTICKMLNLEGW